MGDPADLGAAPVLVPPFDLGERENLDDLAALAAAFARFARLAELAGFMDSGLCLVAGLWAAVSYDNTFIAH